MSIKLLWALGLSLILNFAYSQDSDCVKFREANVKLINENVDLATQLKYIRFDNRRINSNYKELQKVHDCCKNNNSKGNVNRDSIDACNKLNCEKLLIITKERDSLKELTESIGKLDYTSRDAKPEKRSLNVFVLEMSIKLKDLKDLKDEAADFISVRNKQVHFKGKNYYYDDEVLFIPYKAGNQIERTMNDSLTYFLNRLIKLVKKYDFKVKVKLVGECSMDDFEKNRKRISIDRAENMKTYLQGESYNLPASLLARMPREGKLDKRTGVSIKIVRK
jgi:hypothetical protein